MWLYSFNYFECLVVVLFLGVGDWDLICLVDGWGNVCCDFVGVLGGEGVVLFDSDDDEFGLVWVIV